MSLEYVVYLSTPFSPVEVQQTLSHPTAGNRVTNAERAAPSHGRANGPVASGLHPVTQDMISDSYGFRPTVGVVYGLDKIAEPVDRERLAISEIADLLHVNPGDAYVGYAGLRTALVRRGGRATVNEVWLEGRPWLRPDLHRLLGPDYAVEFVPEPE